MTDPMTAAQAARRLGVKPATLYAYVSRGLLRRDKAADGRGSLFDPDEVEQLARRGRPRRPAGVADITVESAITQIAAGQLRYRGHDAVRLAASRSFEDVAELLWSGELPARPGNGPPATPRLRRHGRRGRRPPPRWRSAGAHRPRCRPGRCRWSGSRSSCRPWPRPIRCGCTWTRRRCRPRAGASSPGWPDCLPPASPRPGAGPDRRIADRDLAAQGVPELGVPELGIAEQGIADRLWSRLAGGRPSPALLQALSAALVLLADHELAASTLAARTTASVRADPYAVVQTGMAAVSGVLHGGASLGMETMLAAASGPADVPRVMGELLRRGEHILGFGHFAYPAGDPRAILLLDLVAAPRRSPGSSRWPKRCWPRPGASPCPSRTSTLPSPPWPGWPA